MKLTESYLKRLIKQVINEGLTQGQFNITQDPTDYKDLYAQYVPDVLTPAEFTTLVNGLNEIRPALEKLGINPRNILKTKLYNAETNKNQY